jgi:hypothetical protein
MGNRHEGDSARTGLNWASNSVLAVLANLSERCHSF